MNAVKETKRRIIFDDYDINGYKDWAIEDMLGCGDYDDREDITDAMIEERAYELTRWDWEEFVTYEMEKIFAWHKVLVFGEIGRWSGASRGFSVFDNFDKALSFMLKDNYNIIVYEEDDELHFKNLHHDGQCDFTVRILTNEGESYLENWELTQDTAVNDILNELIERYTERPRYCERVWGLK